MSNIEMVSCLDLNLVLRRMGTLSEKKNSAIFIFAILSIVVNYKANDFAYYFL